MSPRGLLLLAIAFAVSGVVLDDVPLLGTFGISAAGYCLGLRRERLARGVPA